MLPDPGSAVRVVMTKWGDRPHWEFDATYLGSDEHGDWLGIARSTVMTRPGMTYVAPTAQVGLVPAPGPDVERGWLATFHDVAEEALDGYEPTVVLVDENNDIVDPRLKEIAGPIRDKWIEAAKADRKVDGEAALDMLAKEIANYKN